MKKKKSRNFLLPPSQSTLKNGSENRPCLRGVSVQQISLSTLCMLCMYTSWFFNPLLLEQESAVTRMAPAPTRSVVVVLIGKEIIKALLIKNIFIDLYRLDMDLRF